VEDIGALLDEAGGSASLFGHSSGAVLALEAARALPDRIPRLALYEPPLIVDDSRPPVPEDYVTRLRGLVATDRRGDAVAYFLIEGPGVPGEAVEAMRREPAWPSFETIAHTLVYDGTIMDGLLGGSLTPLERWASVRVPTLLMDGGASPPWRRNAVRALASVLPDVRHRTLEGQDHGPADEVLAPVLEGFLAG
jgi:pimeloyl-ACP methyl ester carboxylesterase